MIYYVIPARKNSKGLKFKNRTLFDYTATTIPYNFYSNVIVTTDDEEILNKSIRMGFHYLERSSKLSEDTTSTKHVLRDVIQQYDIKDDDIIVMLYLTYPNRSWEDIQDALDYFNKNNLKSMLCKKEVQSHPFLCMYEKDNDRGQQIIEHNLYRRQDYPKCFEISHFVTIFEVSELDKLNWNLYNEDTSFFKIKNYVDVDTGDDYHQFLENMNDKRTR